MQVYAFVGKTGTGKSYNAQSVAKKNNINYIIDDAILIKDTKVIAGKSAKTEASKIASVKAAIFLDEERRESMIKAIKLEKPEKILILGTSDEMVEKIATNLELGNIYKTIYIEEVATQEDINKANYYRNKEGKHVVPVPTLEIKKQFSGYFLDSLRNFGLFNKSENESNPGENIEKTIIRPTYSYLGKYTISDRAINSIISYVVSKVDGVARVLRVSTEEYSVGAKLDLDIEILYGTHIPSLSSKIKNVVIYALDNSTGINLYGININVKSIVKN